MDTWQGINTQPITLNKYLYAHADPVFNTDPSGNFISSLTAGQSIAFILAASAIVTYQVGSTAVSGIEGGGPLSDSGRGWALLASMSGVGSRLFALINNKVEEEEGQVVSVYHGSLGSASIVRAQGLDFSRAPAFVSRDILAAQDAISPERQMLYGISFDVGVIESQVPAEDFTRVMLPFERPYRGFYPYNLDSTEITLRTPEAIELFNRHIVR